MTAVPQEDPLPPMARAFQAALASYATKYPDHAGDLPWHWLSDPEKLEKFAQRDAEATRIRRALERGAAPEDLGLVKDGLARVMAERGLR